MIEERAPDKVCTLSEAIAEHVHPGDALYLAGMAHGEVSAAVHEILRQEINSLTLIRPVSEVPSLLISEGRVETLIHAYTSVLYPKRGYAAIKVQERGYFPHLIEFSHFGLNLALQASQLGIPFMPAITQLGVTVAGTLIRPRLASLEQLPHQPPTFGLPHQLLATLLPSSKGCPIVHRSPPALADAL